MSQRNYSVINRKESNPYINAVNTQNSNELSGISLDRTIGEINSFLQDESLSSKGPARFKNSIINKSRSRELSSVIPKKSKINTKRMIQQLRSQNRYNSENHCDSLKQEDDYSQMTPLLLTKIKSKNTYSMKSYDRGINSTIDSYKIKNPSPLLDKHFICDMGKKYSNKLSFKARVAEHNTSKAESSHPSESTIQIPLFSKPIVLF